jgi:hypothetical protein
MITGLDFGPCEQITLFSTGIKPSIAQLTSIYGQLQGYVKRAKIHVIGLVRIGMLLYTGKSTRLDGLLITPLIQSGQELTHFWVIIPNPRPFHQLTRLISIDQLFLDLWPTGHVNP